ncbi:MAG TPA: hypothetical protein PKD28_00490 [Candidatus Saccharibacteria bacterium]|nr:hypothetical protein [Candidatus Saccharibacteria bacterium]
MKNRQRTEAIIYGGAFNPPTVAHVAVLQACVDYAKLSHSEVWVMPSGSRRDKTIAVSRQRRLEYIEAMIADVKCGNVTMRVETSELDQIQPTETYQTIRRLRQQYPHYDFRFVFGADSTQTMASWRGGEELLRQLPMLVVDRPGYEINPRAKRAVRLPVTTINTSSTEVRRRCAAGESVGALVSRSVYALL